MGVDQPQSPKPPHAGSGRGKLRDQNAVRAAHNDVLDLSLAVAEDADLPFDLEGQFRQRTGQFGINDKVRGDFSAVKSLKLFDLQGFEPGGLTVQVLNL
jgi:hypothetical protein